MIIQRMSDREEAKDDSDYNDDPMQGAVEVIVNTNQPEDQNQTHTT